MPTWGLCSMNIFARSFIFSISWDVCAALCTVDGSFWKTCSRGSGQRSKKQVLMVCHLCCLHQWSMVEKKRTLTTRTNRPSLTSFGLEKVPYWLRDCCCPMMLVFYRMFLRGSCTWYHDSLLNRCFAIFSIRLLQVLIPKVGQQQFYFESSSSSRPVNNSKSWTPGPPGHFWKHRKISLRRRLSESHNCCPGGCKP